MGADTDEQAARMRAMWSAVALTSINDAIRDTATESKEHKGRALKTLTMWANSRNGREVLSLAGINPDKRVTDRMLAFAANYTTAQKGDQSMMPAPANRGFICML